MARSSNIALEIFNNYNTFNPGDLLCGSISLNNTKNINEVELIIVQVIGICETQWTRPSPTIPYLRVYKEKRKALDIKIELYKKSSENVMSDNNYKFEFILPPDLPSSFKSSITKVFYNLKGLVKTTKTQKKKMPFNVIRKVDLNYSEEFFRPTTFDLHHTFWNSKSVSITFKTYKGFSPGQKLPIKIMLLNKDNVKLKSFIVTILQNIEYVIAVGYANKQKYITSAKYENILGKFVEICNLELEIPQIDASTMESDNMVNISYVLRIEAVFHYYITLWKDYPVNVGTIPVRFIPM